MKLDKLRIAVLFPTTWLGSYWGTLLDELSKFCTARLFTGGPWSGLEEGDHPDIKIVGSTRRAWPKEPEAGGYGGGMLVPSLEIVPLLFKYRPNLVFSASFSLWTAVAIALRAVGGWQVIIVWEGSTPRVDCRESPVRTKYRRILGRQAAAIITNSRAGERYLVDFLGLPVSKVQRRPYQLPSLAGLGATDSHPQPGKEGNPLTLLSVGKVVPRKGMNRLFDALDILQARHVTEWRLRVVGTGDEVETLKSRAREGGYADQIEWIGWVVYDDLASHFHASDVFVFTTLEDTWGMVVLEAMAMGLPVISSVWAGSSDLVAGNEVGVVCDPHDVDSLADHIQAMIEDPEHVRRMGRAAAVLMADNRPSHGAAFWMDTARRVIDPASAGSTLQPK